ncbi:NAD-dependent deacylase [Fulvivirga sp. RKSG066]|uniref:SIR2 family NAD-dependent protein deacylase n=1 Tax=Fulvivirga aurantia TaxID=2529383 RepID=UPI0012BC8845|nr:NAD-dependent deacylase [Fulvivirga aurantia]MTI19828.1 NAD-dependent deacylase [Fulvivirga aurantia]
MIKIVALTGAGISAESGIATFRDANGLWEGHDVMEVASPQGWAKNPELVLDFYNQRRKAALTAEPNAGHEALAKLEEDFDVTVVTQNVDNLHERAGSSNVVHLHGQLFQSRSSVDENLIYEMEGWELNLGDTCEKGSQLRPNIVWFGEMVPMMEVAARVTQEADIFMIVGTSLAVYPAASLIDFTPHDASVYLVDPKLPPMQQRDNLYMYQENASTGVEKVRQELMKMYR